MNVFAPESDRIINAVERRFFSAQMKRRPFVLLDSGELTIGLNTALLSSPVHATHQHPED
jgi:hypothetical protein